MVGGGTGGLDGDAEGWPDGGGALPGGVDGGGGEPVGGAEGGVDGHPPVQVLSAMSFVSFSALQGL